ncbi:T9SS type A sorting domain-containing protein [Nonlabens xiamenensis]|uniref:T9SS type A sorting domain-containing protein n=1 Tax=Nonlabens xiamenensis TaxID=2341043 RepID=UPI000F609D13|nr:T9SS type A sorting domain-containing protein [Nonlabens xiamenensis]
MKNILPYLVCTFVVSLFGLHAKAQTDLFNVNGGGPLPTGWTATNNVTSQDIDRGSYYLLDTGSPSDIITTDTYDLSGFAAAEFTLDVATFGSGTSNPAIIEISDDGGTSFSQVETSNTPSSSSYVDGGTFTINSLTNQVVIRLSTNASGRGVRLQNLVLTASGTATSDTRVNFVTTSLTVNEGDMTASVDVSITNQDANNSTTVDVVLTSGSATDLNNYLTQTLNFPAGSGMSQTTTLTITDDMMVEGTEDFVFNLQNVNGGNNANAGVNDTFTLTIEDNDFPPAPDLIITEVADPSDEFSGRFVELYNNGATTIDFSVTTVFISRYVNAGTTTGSDTQLTGTIAPGDYYVVASDNNVPSWETFYGVTADIYSPVPQGNGDDSYTLSLNAAPDNGGFVFDVYGAPGTDGTGQPWEYTDSRAVRLDVNDSPANPWQSGSWLITSAATGDMTPGFREPVNYLFDGTQWTPADPVGNSTNLDNIIVSSGSVALNGDVDVRRITVDNAASLDLGMNTVNLTNNIVNNGVLISHQAALNISGTSAQAVLGNSFVVEDLIINNPGGLSLETSVEVEGVLSLTNGTLTTNDNLTLLSTASSSAVIDEVISGSISGNINVEQFYPAQRAFRFVSPSVNMTGSVFTDWQQNGLNPGDMGYQSGLGTQVTGGAPADGFDVSNTNNPSLFMFDNATQAWSAVTATNTLSYSAGTPVRLMIRGDRSISLTTANTTPTPTTLVTTGTPVIGAVNVGGLASGSMEFSMVGNPYQAQVDLSEIMATGTNDVDNSVYYAWDPTLGDRGAYVAYDFGSGSNNVMGSEVNQFIQPQQAFFIQTLEDGIDTGSLAPAFTFVESNKISDVSTTNTYSTPGQENYVQLGLFKTAELASGKARDGVVLRFDDLGTTSSKPRNLDENIALMDNGQQRAILTHAPIQSVRILDLDLNGLTGTDYTFRFDNQLEFVNLYLLDSLTGTEQAILPGLNDIQITFDPSNTASIATDRFELKLEPVTLSVGDDAFAKAISIYPNPVNEGILWVENLDEESGNVALKVYNINGQLLIQEHMTSINGRAELKGLSALSSGLYLLQISHGERNETLRFLKR